MSFDTPVSLVLGGWLIMTACLAVAAGIGWWRREPQTWHRPLFRMMWQNAVFRDVSGGITLAFGGALGYWTYGQWPLFDTVLFSAAMFLAWMYPIPTTFILGVLHRYGIQPRGRTIAPAPPVTPPSPSGSPASRLPVPPVPPAAPWLPPPLASTPTAPRSSPSPSPSPFGTSRPAGGRRGRPVDPLDQL